MQNGTAALGTSNYHQITSHGRNILVEKLHLLEERWRDILEVIKNQTMESYDFTKSSHELQDINLEMQRINYVLQTASTLVPITTNLVVRGSRVTVESLGQIQQYRVVDSIEADPNNGYVSDKCPLGIGLLGKSVGDIVRIEGPRVTRNYKIVKIEQEEA